MMLRRQILLIITVVLLSAATLYASEYSDQQAIIRYNQGVAYQKQGDAYYNNAIVEYKEAIKWNPELYSAYHNLGIIYIDLKDYTSAEEMFKVTIRQASGEVGEYNNLAYIYLKMGKLSDSESILKRAEILSISSYQIKQLAELYHNLGIAYSENKNYEEAQRLLTKAVILVPTDGRVHYNLGIVNTQLDRLSDALNEFEKAAEISPEDEQTHLALASLYIKSNQRENAIQELRRAHQINPSNSETNKILDKIQGYPQAAQLRTTVEGPGPSSTMLSFLLLIFLSTVLLVIFNFEKIKAKLNDLIYGNPDNEANKLILRATAARNKGNIDECMRYYKEAVNVLSVALTSDSSQLKKDLLMSRKIEMRDKLVSLFKTYVKIAHSSQKESCKVLQEQAEKILSICGKRFSILYILGELLYLQNDYEKSLRYFEEANEHERHTLACHWMGVLHYKLLKYTSSIRILGSEKIPFDKNLIDVYYLIDDRKELARNSILFLALSYYEIKDWGNSIKYFESLRAIHKLDNDTKYFLAKAYENTKEYQRFVELISECIKSEPNDPDLFFERAKGYRRIWMLEEAASDLKRALAIKSEDHALYNELALVCYLKNDFESSVACFNKLVHLKHDIFGTYFRLGIVYEKTKQYDKAVESYLTAAKYKSNNKSLYVRIGIACCKNRKYDQAITYFDKAKELGDDSNQFLYFCGVAHSKTNNYSDAISIWERLLKRSGENVVLAKYIKILKNRLNNNSKTLMSELSSELGRKNWDKSYDLLKQIKNIPTEKNTVKELMPYVRNRLCPELLRENKRFKIVDIFKDGLKDDPTNYKLLHNLTVLYYWWATDKDNKAETDERDAILWEKLIGYWTAATYNDEFWVGWTKNKSWIDKSDIIDTAKIQHKLIGHLETKILSSIDTNKQKDDKKALAMHEQNLKKLNYEKKFISYYKELREVLLDDISSIPDTYSETLIKDLGVQDYIVELADLAVQKYPRNENIRKIRFYLSPFKYIALLIDDKNYSAAIRELESLPANQKHNATAQELGKLAKLRLGADCLMCGNSQNDILQAGRLWSDCQISGDPIAKEFIEDSAINAIKKHKMENRPGDAISVGELALEHIFVNQEISALLSILLNERGVGRWNSSNTTDSNNPGVQDLERAVKYNTGNIKAKKNLSIMYNNIGVLFAGRRDLKKALDYFNRSLKLIPGDKQALENIKKVFSEVDPATVGILKNLYLTENSEE